VIGRTLIAGALALILAGCGDPDRVDASKYDSFWLWAGVAPKPMLQEAHTIYLLDGEVRASEHGRYVVLRPGVPRLSKPDVWLVVRTDTLDWPPAAYAILRHHLDSWGSSNPRLQGIQIDFDARTRHLGDYATFLEAVRRDLPPRYKLSITGLLDWSANGLVGQGGVNCPFTFTNGKATQDSTSANVVVTYSGTVCGIPVNGTETVKK